MPTDNPERRSVTVEDVRAKWQARLDDNARFGGGDCDLAYEEFLDDLAALPASTESGSRLDVERLTAVMAGLSGVVRRAWLDERTEEVAATIAAEYERPAPQALRAEGSAAIECPDCGGAGWTVGYGADPLPSGEPGEPYPVQEPCSTCGGSGAVSSSEPEAPGLP